MNKPLKNPKRLIININEELHKDMKKRALFRGCTLTQWVLIAIRQRIEEEIDLNIKDL